MMAENNAVLVLADGTIVAGRGFGAEGRKDGEVVFNTSMGGYQEALTDPSYKYQIMMMTFPLIGNYGINDTDYESAKIQAEGFVIRELSPQIGHSKAKKSLDAFLKEYNIPGIEGVDTRYLTKKIRVIGAMNGILKYPYEESELPELTEKAKKLASISEMDLVDLVTIKETKKYDVGGKKTVVLVDCGAKESIIKGITSRGVNVIRVPAKTSADAIMSYEPNGIVLSNGPGDPERVDYVIDTVKKLLPEKVPTFGICLGLQLVSLACGAKTYKLKFGHRGANQPVKDLATGRVHITSQNHGFAVDANTAKDANINVSHINLNDGSVEGVRHKECPMWAVQYHPEAHPGPRYNYYLFDEFVAAMK
jgi:carbamoyl-phosphate synthase small subunit